MPHITSMSFLLRGIASFLSRWRTFIHFLIPLDLHIDAILIHSSLRLFCTLTSHEDRECMKGERDLPTSISLGYGRPLLSLTIVHHLAPSASIYAFMG